MTNRRKVIIDTDTGIDDALGILLALASPEFELLGLTTVAGNARLEDVTNHALIVREVGAAEDIPVCCGCWRPLTRPLRTQAYVYGEDEDLGLKPHANWHNEIDKRHGVTFLLEQVSKFPGDVTLIAIGPLTNIATAMIMDPSFAGNLKEIVLMGGAATVIGNTTAAAEFNMYVDPEAAAVVFSSGVPLTMVGLDVTGKTALWPEDRFELDRIGTPVARYIRQITRHYLDKNKPCFLYDPLAVAVALEPTLCQEAPFAHVDIEVGSGPAAGMTLVDLPGRFGGEPNAKVCLKVDTEAFMKLFWQRVVHYHERGH